MELNPKKMVAAAVAAVAVAVAAVVSGGAVGAAAAASITQQVEHERQRRKRRHDELEERPIMKNLYKFRESPQIPLGPAVDRFGAMVADINRGYVKQLTHLYSWELLELAELVKAGVEAPRAATTKSRREKRPVKHPGVPNRGRPPKLNYVARLVHLLEWLNTGDTATRRQFNTGWSRSSCDEDRKHVLKAINVALANEIRWPTEEERKMHHSLYDGIFVGCVGILDVTEWAICKPKNSKLENETFSGKPGTNTMKTLAVIDKDGLFIWVDPLVKGRVNDRTQFTNCDLYLNAGRYFSEGEWMASDGGFQGNGPAVYSFNDLRGDRSRQVYNLAFTEVRKGIENAFGRVQMWFPILGVQQREWNCDLELLELSVEAAMKLHNWMIRRRGLSYNAQNDARNHLTYLY